MALKFEYDKELRTAKVCGVDDKSCEEIIIPATVEYYKKKYKVTSIGGCAFSDCKLLTSVTIPDSITSIGEHALSGCVGELIINSQSLVGTSYRHSWESVLLAGANFSKLTIGDSVTSIGDHAFCDCKSLTSVTIGNSVTSIGDYAFYKCTSLTSVTIPDSVISIGSEAFRGCSALTSVTIGNSVASIGRHAFNGCTSLTEVTIPDSVTSISMYVFGVCPSLAAFHGKFASADNRCLIVGGVLKYSALAGLTSYTIPDSVTSIGDYAFSGCSRLTEITIPDSVTSIGISAFDGIYNLKVCICNNEDCVNISKNAFEHSVEIKYIGKNSVTRAEKKTGLLRRLFGEK